MSQHEEVARLIHNEIEHFQQIASGGDRIALLMALSSYVRWTSHLIPHSEDIVWLRDELDKALEKFRKGEVRTLGNAFGIPDRTHKKLTKLQHKHGSLSHDYDHRTVGTYLHKHKARLESLDRPTFEQLGYEVGSRRGSDPADRLQAQRKGCMAYLLYRCPTSGSRFAVANALWERLRTNKELREFVEDLFSAPGRDAVGQMVESSGSLVAKWHYEFRRLELYWKVLSRVLDDRVSWEDAYQEAADLHDITVEKARTWFEEGRALAHAPE